MEALDQALKLVGAVVVAGGGLALIVYQVFKHLAAKWLDAKFDERLQALRHEHGKEIEKLRFRISALLDRTTKLHQREFEVLPEIWFRLNDAFWIVRRFVSPMQSYPDIDQMSAPQREEFITSSRLTEWQKTELRDAEQRNETYQKQIFWHNLNAAKNSTTEAYSYFKKNGIFVDSQIRSSFSAIHDLIWNALTEHQFNEEHSVRPRQSESISELNLRGETLVKELEVMVHERLWPADTNRL